MDTPDTEHAARIWTPTELRKLSPEERGAILAAAAALAEEMYWNDPELTAFEAIGVDDLFGESSNSIYCR